MIRIPDDKTINVYDALTDMQNKKIKELEKDVKRSDLFIERMNNICDDILNEIKAYDSFYYHEIYGYSKINDSYFSNWDKNEKLNNELTKIKVLSKMFFIHRFLEYKFESSFDNSNDDIRYSRNNKSFIVPFSKRKSDVNSHDGNLCAEKNIEDNFWESVNVFEDEDIFRENFFENVEKGSKDL